MITVAIGNQKGGVGKTTTTYNLGFTLSSRGRKVLVIDSDPQASLTVAFNQEPANGTEKLLTGEPLPLYQINDNLTLIPSSIGLAALPAQMGSWFDPNGALKKGLDKLARILVTRFDYCLIDCPPSLDRLMLNALVAANHVIIPTLCQALSLGALPYFMDTMDLVKTVNPGLKIMAVIPTMYNASRKVEKDALEYLQKEFGYLCHDPLPYRVEYLNASLERRPVNNGQTEYWNELAETVEERAIR